jgi:hypothetical protein
MLHMQLAARFPPTSADMDKDFKKSAIDAFLETDREFLALAAQVSGAFVWDAASFGI